MRKNVGTVDALFRITLGLTGLAYGIGKMARRPYRTPWLLLALSAMKVAEGTTRFCPMLYSMGTSSRGSDILGNLLTRFLGSEMQQQQQTQLKQGDSEGQTQPNAQSHPSAPSAQELGQLIEESLTEAATGSGRQQQEPPASRDREIVRTGRRIVDETRSEPKRNHSNS